MDKSIRLKLGEKIRRLRNKLGYTQDKFAEEVGIDYKYLQRKEGKNPPNLKLDTIQRFAKAFKISVSKLLDFK